MRQFWHKHKTLIAGAVIGAAAGFLYWRFIGCQSGSCGITSSARNSTLYFMLMGMLLSQSFKSNTSPRNPV